MRSLVKCETLICARLFATSRTVDLMALIQYDWFKKK